MSTHYAIFTYRAEGPIKSWAALRAAQTHNSRETPIAHAENDAEPVHLIGGGQIVADVRDRLRQHGIDPDRMRKGGVIAYEAVLTASRSFFFRDECSPSEDARRFQQWINAQKAFLLKRFGPHRIISLVAHFDERTPHLHVIILPLERKADGRRKDGVDRWSLVGRTISGPGMYQQVQDEYAAAMEPFGLSRGASGDGKKHRPVRDYLAELKAQEVANGERAAELEAGLARLREQISQAQEERNAIQKGKQAIAASKAAWEQTRAKIEAERNALREDQRLVDDLFAALENSRLAAIRFMQMVQCFPESQWTPETLLMVKAASPVASMAVAQRDVLPADAARIQGRER